MKAILDLALVFAAIVPMACTLHDGGERRSADEPAAGKHRTFELRTYTASPGKLSALNARFREHTNALFAKHGMTVIGFFTPRDGDRHQDTLVYMLAFPDPDARDQAWKAFRADPEWVRVKAESEVDGPLTTRIESVILEPTGYSPLR